MEIFRQIEERFEGIDVKFAEVNTHLQRVGAVLTDMRSDFQSLRGSFASIEAMLIVNAAQMADFKTRLEALEQRGKDAA